MPPSPRLQMRTIVFMRGWEERINHYLPQGSPLRSTAGRYRSKQHARTLHWRMPMRLSALCIDDGTNTPGCLPLQRMPAPIRQRLRHVHAGEEREPDRDRPDEAIYA